MSKDAIFAHSLPGEPRERWERLFNHLQEVGATAERLAAKFGADKAGLAAGLLHDIGKRSAAFQAYIDGNGSSPDHSTAGAVEAIDLFPGPIGRLIAFAIAGHHAGLADGAGVSGSLDVRLARRADLPEYSGWRELVPGLPTELTLSFPSKWGDPGYTLAFLGRMIFSCLVDADFIGTERFYAEAAGERRERGDHTPLVTLRERLDRHLDRLAAGAKSTPLNARRAEILRHARQKAALPPGLFTMTVPTGGGKTLAGLAFALDHAIAHGLDRVVYVIPYTSIIEQTAAVFREALKDENGDAADVLEHHGNVDWDRDETDADGRDALAKLRRAAENWDVPVVVTTAVQFFESLHASRTSRCRKLHNLVRSVIVLDEAQTLPLPLLRPCMAAIEELANNYRTSVVLCTATQPALKRQDSFKGGLDIPDARELAPDPNGLYDALRRVTVEHMPDPIDDATIAARFAAQAQMLCIVNSRKHAQALYGAIGDMDGARHLTTLMCPAHRRQVLGKIRVALTAGEPVRLVSTSLIEAGVDVDFPEVWRAQNGLDSIAQAAGRCNREGKPNPGRVVIFAAADSKLPAMFRQQVEAMQEALRLYPDDPLGLAAVRAYFQQLYWSKGDARLDAATLENEPYPILPALHRSLGADGTLSTPYDSVARAFQMIDDPGKPVIIRWQGADPMEIELLLNAIRHAPRPPGNVLRKLQQYTVSIPERVRTAMIGRGDIVPVSPLYGDRFVVLDSPVYYDDRMGFQLDLPDQSFFM